jgi:hypothetical protein
MKSFFYYCKWGKSPAMGKITSNGENHQQWGKSLAMKISATFMITTVNKFSLSRNTLV